MSALPAFIPSCPRGSSCGSQARKRNKREKKEKEVVKPSLFTYDVISCIEKSKESTKMLEVINEFNIVMGYNINIEK